jgi:hypothetical protein
MIPRPPLATPHTLLAVPHVPLLKQQPRYLTRTSTGTRNATITLLNLESLLCLGLLIQFAVCVLPLVGNGTRDDLAVFAVDACPRHVVRVAGDGSKSTQAVWYVRAGDREDGAADAEGDEKGEDESLVLHLDVCGGEVVGLVVFWCWLWWMVCSVLELFWLGIQDVCRIAREFGETVEGECYIIIGQCVNSLKVPYRGCDMDEVRLHLFLNHGPVICPTYDASLIKKKHGDRPNF